MKSRSYILAFLTLICLAALSMHGCKRPNPYDPYDKFGLTRMIGWHNWHTQYSFYYHNGTYSFDSTQTFKDTSFLIAVDDYKNAIVGDQPMFITNPYTLGSVIIFSTDTTGHLATQYYKQTLLYYDYNANTVKITSGVFSNDPGSDSTYNYTGF